MSHSSPCPNTSALPRSRGARTIPLRAPRRSASGPRNAEAAAPVAADASSTSPSRHSAASRSASSTQSWVSTSRSSTTTTPGAAALLGNVAAL
ncbi:Uncharacterised protein [Mycobacteroides abscessus]|nr:Uncharacterised protein [Mycobacteroides abscessus]